MDSKDGNCSSSPSSIPLKETRGREDVPTKSCKNASNARAKSFELSSQDGFLFNPSPVRMSNRRLEMCTEILGSETGTSYYHTFDEIILPSSSSSSSSSLTNSRRKCDQLKKPEKKQEKELPPPLTTMSGEGRIRLMPQREDGRLVIKAVAVPTLPPRANFLQARRSSEDFPPPLTTMAGETRIRLMPQREDGRLVIQAVAVPIRPPPRANFSQAKSSEPESESD